MICVFIFFFFFSSRRRHTRLTCDWSSDVCSSDLIGIQRRIGSWVALEKCIRQTITSSSVTQTWLDRKSTRLNSSHMSISYAVFCLKKKKKNAIKLNIIEKKDTNKLK